MDKMIRKNTGKKTKGGRRMKKIKRKKRELVIRKIKNTYQNPRGVQIKWVAKILQLVATGGE